jgi:hypothetical protein
MFCEIFKALCNHFTFQDHSVFYKNYSVDAAVDAAQWQQTTSALEELKMVKPR